MNDDTPRMPEWAGAHEKVSAPLPDGRSRTYYRWAVPADAPGGTTAGDATPHPATDAAHGRVAADATAWTPEAGPAEGEPDA
jgi:hypothetical protein